MHTSYLQGSFYSNEDKEQRFTFAHKRFLPFPTLLCLPLGPLSQKGVWLPVLLEVPGFSLFAQGTPSFKR